MEERAESPRLWREELSLRTLEKMTGLPNESRSCSVVKHNFNPSFREGVTFFLSSFAILSELILRTYVDLSSRWMEIFIYLSRTFSSSLPKSRWILHASSRLPSLILLSNGCGSGFFFYPLIDSAILE